MHNVCLSVLRELLNCVVSGNNYKVKLSSHRFKTLSNKMVAFQSYILQEINRKPRPLIELARFRTIEFRSFFLCLEPVVLSDVLDVTVYTVKTTYELNSVTNN